MRYYIVLFCLFPTLLMAQLESAYINLLAKELGGQTEVTVPNGRVDILTDDYAIEVERADKWKNSIGQALWYAQQTNKKPGIIIILESPEDFKHFQRLNSSLAYAGLAQRVTTWIYPNDFQSRLSSESSEPKELPSGTKTAYWLTKSSKKRHRSNCKWYENSIGRYCTADEGIAAGCCY